MANIKITHLYIYAAYSSIIASLQWPLWLIWVWNMTGIWISCWNLWSLHSLLWDLFTLQRVCVSHQQPDEANGTQLLHKVCGQKGAQVARSEQAPACGAEWGLRPSPSPQGLQRPWRQNSIGSSCKYSLKSFLLCLGDLKGISTEFSLLLCPFPCIPHVIQCLWRTQIKPVVVQRCSWQPSF